MQCEQSTISRQLKFGKTASVVRRSSLAERRTSNSGRRRRRHSSLVRSRSLRSCQGWAAEQPTEITTTAIDLLLLPTDTNEDRGVQNLELVLQQMHTALMALTRSWRRTTLSPTRGRIRWRHGRDCRSDMIRRQEEENETCCARSFLLDGALFWNNKRGSNAGSPSCLATRRRWTSWTTRSSLLVLSHWCWRSLLVFVHVLNLFATVQLLEETPAVLSLG